MTALDKTTQDKIPQLRFNEFAEPWEEKRLADISTFYNGRAYKQQELLTSGKYRVLRVGNFFSNDSWYYSDLELDSNKYCVKGDLLYAWSASFGPRIWHGETTIYHYHIWKVVPSVFVTTPFLFTILDNETLKLKAISANGLGMLHITKGAIEAWKVHYPSFPSRRRSRRF